MLVYTVFKRYQNIFSYLSYMSPGAFHEAEKLSVEGKSLSADMLKEGAATHPLSSPQS
jgi:hypothetical protein